MEAIVGDLGNAAQGRTVSNDRERTGVRVLTGPGSDKSRVLVHRIACLIRMQRGGLRDVLVPACNRHAAVGARERLKALIGEDAAGVAVSTCDALATRVVGAIFAGLRLHRRRRPCCAVTG